jgi:hypothetical protein
MVWNGEDRTGLVFRNRSENRSDDVARMRRIVDRIIQDRNDLADSDREGLTNRTDGCLLVVTVVIAVIVVVALTQR